jgi:hypothetical protein
MKKRYILIGLSLFISLFIYLFYRTERTIVNEIVIGLISKATYTSLKATIAHSLPLNDVMIYSLPGGLWIFCITLTSKPYYIDLNRWRIDCVYIPLIFCCSLEMLQLIHLTNGRFDFMDIVFFVSFWLLGRSDSSGCIEKRHILTTLNSETILCLVSYSIVYLAHVLK